MAIFPPSAARGFLAQKLGISYEDVSAEFLDGNSDLFLAKAGDKEYTIEGKFSPLSHPTGIMICGGGKWDFTIREEKTKDS